MKKTIFRFLFYIAGLFSIATGVSISLNSGLGVSPVNSFPIAISTATGINKGLCVSVVFIFYILLQIIILRRDFKIKNLLQVFFASVFGYFVNFTSMLVEGFVIPTYFGKLLMVLISVVLLGFGLCLYLNVDIVPMPSEGLAMSISQKIPKLPFHRAKVIFDCTSVVLAVIVSLVGSGQLSGVREGTVLMALFAGNVMAFFSKYLKAKIEALCFDLPKDHEEAAEAEALEQDMEG